MRSARATAAVGAPAATVYEFLADLGNHWRLASRWIEVAQLTPAEGPADGATVLLNGPLGISRTVTTRVDAAVAPLLVRGQGRSGATCAHVEWRLEELSPHTRVQVEVRLVSAQALDRAIWTLGGRAWLARRLAQTLAELDATLDAHRREG